MYCRGTATIRYEANSGQALGLIGRIERGFRRSQCFSRGSMTNKKTTKPAKATRASVIKNVSMTYTPSDWSTSSTNQVDTTRFDDSPCKVVVDGCRKPLT